MKRASVTNGIQMTLLDDEPRFPSTRYLGSKAKLVDWIWTHLSTIDFDSCLDAFGGTGVVAYRLKQEGKAVTYNDSLCFNSISAKGLIENSQTRLSEKIVEQILTEDPRIDYPQFIFDTFHDVYFTDDENLWIDRILTNIRQLENPYEFALAFYALCQSCIIKRPYNLFHRKNLYVRFAEVERSFGNKASWDRPFSDWFRAFASEANQAVFDNGRANHVLNMDACDVPGSYDLVYIDTPYMPAKGYPVDYRDYYHFLEGLAMYESWGSQLDRDSKHLRLTRLPNEWIAPDKIYSAFARIFERFRSSDLVVSYRSDGIPSEYELVRLMKRFKSRVSVEHYGQYKYALSTNSQSKEILILGS